MASETTQDTQINAAEVYRALGRLEGNQSQTNERISGLEGRMDQMMARIDRLVFTMFGFGATMLAALVAILVRLLLGGE